ncbi:hypothetical protein AAFF_G00210180 [Aldrovandia affinis]|uniref:Uncharacterized protein n=1 Tax=Aldrovandia affinis TaxID=143900 RepID=A0AAD7WUR0_9TELE|nr:hypothetical protein AAFF_G00210180 [Aldrovandia affinis]
MSCQLALETSASGGVRQWREARLALGGSLQKGVKRCLSQCLCHTLLAMPPSAEPGKVPYGNGAKAQPQEGGSGGEPQKARLETDTASSKRGMESDNEEEKEHTGEMSEAPGMNTEVVVGDAPTDDSVSALGSGGEKAIRMTKRGFKGEEGTVGKRGALRKTAPGEKKQTEM